MIAALSNVSALVARFWHALARLEADSTGAPRLDPGGNEEASSHNRITEEEAAYLAILRSPVPF